MARVFVYTTTRAPLDSPRGEACQATIAQGMEKSGLERDVDYTWELWSNYPHNSGQHVAFNAMLAKARQGGYDYLARVDDDVEFLSQRWLAKMLQEAITLGPQFIVSPTIEGLLHPPPMSEMVEVQGVPVKFMLGAIGGACRLHPVSLLLDGPTPYVSDVRQPLGAGDAVGIVKWAKESTAQGWQVWCVWLEHVRVAHATKRQREEHVEYHSSHDTLQRVPYIPAWPRDYA